MLAGGVSHEVKNPLNAIANAARLLPNAKARPELELKLLNIIVEGARRIEDIVMVTEEGPVRMNTCPTDLIVLG